MVPDTFIVLDPVGLGVFWFCTAITILAIAATCSEVMPSDWNVDGVILGIFGTGLVAVDV